MVQRSLVATVRSSTVSCLFQVADSSAARERRICAAASVHSHSFTVCEMGKRPLISRCGERLTPMLHVDVRCVSEDIFPSARSLSHNS
eukprot:6201239-Pleurochrysis_carterae.AAC.3